MKKKLPTSGPQEPIQKPFAGLQLEGLPPENDSPAGAPSGSRRTDSDARSMLRGESPVLRLEKAGRGGKTVIVVHGFSNAQTSSGLDELLAQIKKALGIGGARRGREIELNTSQPGRVREILERMGARPRGVA